MIARGLTTGSFISSREFNLRRGQKETANATHVLYEELMESGYPLLKRKAILRSSKTVSFGNQNYHFKEIPSGNVNQALIYASENKTGSIPSHQKPLLMKLRLHEIFRLGKNTLERLSFRLSFLND